MTDQKPEPKGKFFSNEDLQRFQAADPAGYQNLDMIRITREHNEAQAENADLKKQIEKLKKKVKV